MGHWSRSTLIAAIVLTALLLATYRVHAGCDVVILDFEELRAVDSNTNHGVGQSYTHDGMTLTAQSSASSTPSLDYAGTLATIFVGSTMLFNDISRGEIILTKADGGAFDFLAIALAEVPSFHENGTPVNLGPFDVTFTGTRRNGSTVSQTVTAQPFPEVSAFKLHGFSQVVRVTWFQGGGGAPGLSTHQFDNVTVRVH